jgi:signal transduction histidine kinase
MRRLLFLLLQGSILPGLQAQQPDSAFQLQWSEKFAATDKSDCPAQHYTALAEQYETQLGYNRYTLEYLLKAQECYSESGDSFNYHRLNIKIGDYYQEEIVGNPDANRYYAPALHYFSGTLHKGFIFQAKKGLMLSRIINDRDSGILSDLHALLAFAQQNGLEMEAGEVYHYLVVHHLNRKELEAAYPFIRAGLAINYSDELKWLRAVHLNYMGYYLREKNRCTEAMPFLQESKRLAESLKSLLIQKSACENLAECYRVNGQWAEAYTYARHAFKLTDSLHNSSFTKNARLIEPNTRIRRLELEKQLAERDKTARRRLLFIFGLSAALLLFIALLLWAAFERQKLRSRTQSETEKNRIARLELAALQALIAGQETERLRIARELHDGIGAHVAGIKMYAVSPPRAGTPDLVRQQQIGIMLDEVCTEIRNLSAALSPAALYEAGLAEALHQYINRLQQINLQVQFHYDSWNLPVQLPEELAIHLFRIAQELLNNALKYARASQITLQISAADERINLSVEDDGIGFDATGSYAGQGMKNIRMRADCLRGETTWQSAPGQGTHFLLHAPLGSESPKA